MTKIWKETGFVDGDTWVSETEERKAGEGEKALLPLEAFLETVAATNDVGLGVLIAPLPGPPCPAACPCGRKPKAAGPPNLSRWWCRFRQAGAPMHSPALCPPSLPN